MLSNKELQGRLHLGRELDGFFQNLEVSGFTNDKAIG